MAGRAKVWVALLLCPLAAVAAAASPASAARFNRNHFPPPGTVQNDDLPLVPGTKYVYRGTALEDGRPVRHRVVIIVTDETKVVDGVETTVVWEKDYSNGQLEESELAFYAVDDKGNVWSLGEYPQEYERGRFAGAPSAWVAGQGGARPGVIMPAGAKSGSAAYVEGYAPAVGFKDKGKVYATGQQTCVPAGCYTDVLVVEEWNAFDPAGGHQLKYNAPGVGLVAVGSIDSDDQETLGLWTEASLDPTGQARTDARVTRLDGRAYRVAPGIYGATQPVQGTAGSGQPTALATASAARTSSATRSSRDPRSAIASRTHAAMRSRSTSQMGAADAPRPVPTTRASAPVTTTSRRMGRDTGGG